MRRVDSTVLHTTACPSDPGGLVPLVWLERQIARCERVAIVGVHAWSRMAENSSSFVPPMMPALGFFLPACQISNVHPGLSRHSGGCYSETTHSHAPRSAGCEPRGHSTAGSSHLLTR